MQLALQGPMKGQTNGSPVYPLRLKVTDRLQVYVYLELAMIVCPTVSLYTLGVVNVTVDASDQVDASSAPSLSSLPHRSMALEPQSPSPCDTGGAGEEPCPYLRRPRSEALASSTAHRVLRWVLLLVQRFSRRLRPFFLQGLLLERPAGCLRLAPLRQELADDDWGGRGGD